MALQLGATRRTFKEAGVSDDSADKAAEELAAYDRQFSDVREAINNLRTALQTEIHDLRAETTDMRGDIKVLKWGQGVTFAAVLAILLKLFIH